jgi:hypothetical protein
LEYFRHLLKKVNDTVQESRNQAQTMTGYLWSFAGTLKETGSAPENPDQLEAVSPATMFEHGLF